MRQDPPPIRSTRQQLSGGQLVAPAAEACPRQACKPAGDCPGLPCPCCAAPSVRQNNFPLLPPPPSSSPSSLFHPSPSPSPPSTITTLRTRHDSYGLPSRKHVAVTITHPALLIFSFDHFQPEPELSFLPSRPAILLDCRVAHGSFHQAPSANSRQLHQRCVSDSDRAE